MVKLYFRSFYNNVNLQFEPPFDNCVCIPLTRGHHALIDAEDFDKIGTKKWSLIESTSNGDKYAMTYKLAMHRLILNAPSGVIVDHINHNGLDNRKSNLRLCNKAQNGWNRRATGGYSKYKGVSWSKNKRRWIAEIIINKKTHKLGKFLSQEQAAKAYNEAAIRLQGEFALLNKIE